jgi:DNA-directed RNA polymerase subunit RPC12/RpoP
MKARTPRHGQQQKMRARRVGFLTDIDVYAGLRWTTAPLSEEMAIDMKAENGDDQTLNGNDATVVRCPECGSKDVRRSLRGSLTDDLLSLLSLRAFRCRACHSRFHRRAKLYDVSRT